MKKSQLRNIIKTVIKEQLTNPGYVCHDGNCLDCSNSQYSSYCNNPQVNTFTTLNQCLTSGCGGPDLCKQCQSSHWPGYMVWYNTWTNGAPFNSTNPLQPCTHICSRIQAWQNRCSNATGPQHKNKLGCKIQSAQQLTHPVHHNCNC